MPTAPITFREGLLTEYPIPIGVSIWGGDGITTFPVEDLEVLINRSMVELASDIYLTEYINATGTYTQLPNNAFAVSSAKLSFGFQGNRIVKYTFDISSKRVWLRYFPAVITYRRWVTVQDLDKVDDSGMPILRGDMLIYAKAYILWKMADKELQILRSIDLDTDNGSVNLSELERFSDTMRDRYLDLKPEIQIYTTG